MLIICCLIFIILILKYKSRIFSCINNWLYRKTTYYSITHKPLHEVLLSKGDYGEFLIYKSLRKQEKNGGRFLFNIYLNKNETETTEIDVLLINKDGLFVFESKNYSGWIYGDEHQRTWTQCLPQGENCPTHKERFYNPIFQNNMHINTLMKYIGKNYTFYSIITFSERCSLKDVTVNHPLIRVIKRNQAAQTVNELRSVNNSVLTQVDIDNIYQVLYPFTQVDKTVKQQHIDNISVKLNNMTC